MSKFTIYHNPRCSKSRDTLEILEKNGVKPEVVEYLKNAPTYEELLEIMDMLDEPCAALVRVKEDKYKELDFDLGDKKTVAKNLAKYPELLERPIVVHGKKAVLGRPPENVKKLL